MKAIWIIGGGLAGLSLGILLRQRGVPAIVSEAGHYPRHRVCGEFISGRGIEILRQLGLGGSFFEEECREASTAAFFNERRRLALRDLPADALCVPRHALDAALARRFVAAGGELQVRSRITIDDALAAGVVRASGRRAQPIDDHGRRWVGLKMHVRGARLEADLEMHVQANAYVGLCRLKSEDAVNVCGLFRCQAGEAIVGHEALLGTEGSPLHETLAGAGAEEASRCAVAGLALEPQPIDRNACCVGDALTMIPPITGNGMSMAFESAAIAAEPLEQYAKGARAWEATTGEIADLMERAFASRLAWAERLNAALFSWLGRRALAPIVFGIPRAWEGAFAATRT